MDQVSAARKEKRKNCFCCFGLRCHCFGYYKSAHLGSQHNPAHPASSCTLLNRGGHMSLLSGIMPIFLLTQIPIITNGLNVLQLLNFLCAHEHVNLEAAGFAEMAVITCSLHTEFFGQIPLDIQEDLRC